MDDDILTVNAEKDGMNNTGFLMKTDLKNGQKSVANFVAKNLELAAFFAKVWIRKMTKK